jgi:hypothetical protein
VEYVRRDNCFLKKKVWDRVKGTVFNMPIRPGSSSTPLSEQRLKRTTFNDEFHCDEALRNQNIDPFPLNIRRVYELDPSTGKRHSGTPWLEDGEKLVRCPWNDPEGAQKDLDKIDPWYVTK